MSSGRREIREGIREANGIRLHCAEQGSGPLVVLLHGFPDFWYSWRRQVPALAEAGYHVVAPDLRGYHRSERPRGIEHYRIDALAGDVAALVHSLGGRAHALIGHDWGGVIAWELAMRRPQLLESLVILNAPHPAAFRRELGRPAQILRSWYAAAFQLPWVPERLLSLGNFALLRRILRDGPAGDEVDAYLRALSSEGALSAAINYYRAARRYPPAPPKPISVPTLLLWADRDPFLVPALADGLQDWVHNLRVVRLPQARHWLQLTHAEQVNREIIAFLRRD